MAQVNRPNTYSANTTISSSQVNDDFDTIYDEFNGNISEANLADAAVTEDKIASSAVTTAKIADTNVTSPKLAQAFFRGPYQSNTTNTTPTGLTVQHGWGFINGAVAGTISESVTFPTAFTTLNILTCTYNGVKSGSDPTGVADTTAASRTVATVNASAATGFTVTMRNNNDANFATGDRHVYSWIAIGTV